MPLALASGIFAFDFLFDADPLFGADPNSAVNWIEFEAAPRLLLADIGTAPLFLHEDITTGAKPERPKIGLGTSFFPN